MTAEQFGQVYSRSFQRTVGFLVSRGVPYDAALDAAQDGWMKGWQHRDQLREPDLLRAWVNSIALNSYRSLLRNRSKDVLAVELPRVLAAEPFSTAAIDADLVMRLIPAPARRTLGQFYLDGFSIREVARLWRCTETAARIRLVRARQLARSKI